VKPKWKRLQRENIPCLPGARTPEEYRIVSGDLVAYVYRPWAESKAWAWAWACPFVGIYERITETEDPKVAQREALNGLCKHLFSLTVTACKLRDDAEPADPQVDVSEGTQS
jgi:hypothetical protein